MRGEPVLRPDFARRVVERVRKVKRRRRMRRWAGAIALPCALAIAVTALHFPPRRPAAPSSALVASGGSGRSESIELAMDLSAAARLNSQPQSQPIAFFFPGASTVADLQASDASYWHWYDSWWNP